MTKLSRKQRKLIKVKETRKKEETLKLDRLEYERYLGQVKRYYNGLSEKKRVRRLSRKIDKDFKDNPNKFNFWGFCKTLWSDNDMVNKLM